MSYDSRGADFGHLKFMQGRNDAILGNVRVKWGSSHKGGIMMKILSAIAFALMMTASPALARTTNPNISIPSAQNSGAGIHGLSGTEDGRAVQPGMTSSGATAHRYNFAVRDQDAADIPGLPGTESGSAVKAPSKLS